QRRIMDIPPGRERTEACLDAAVRNSARMIAPLGASPVAGIAVFVEIWGRLECVRITTPSRAPVAAARYDLPAATQCVCVCATSQARGERRIRLQTLARGAHQAGDSAD